MKRGDRFVDTNVLLYLLSADYAKADRAEATLADGGVLSVQVLNEFAAVASRKLRMPVPDIREILTTIRAVCHVVPVDEKTHDLGLHVTKRYGMSIYDSMIVASALTSGCKELLSEELQHGQRIENHLVIRNPFAA